MDTEARFSDWVGQCFVFVVFFSLSSSCSEFYSHFCLRTVLKMIVSESSMRNAVLFYLCLIWLLPVSAKQNQTLFHFSPNVDAFYRVQELSERRNNSCIMGIPGVKCVNYFNRECFHCSSISRTSDQENQLIIVSKENKKEALQSNNRFFNEHSNKQRSYYNIEKTGPKYNYKRDKVIGVNLGGWLVTEPFITPSLYEAASKDGTEAGTPIDEYNYCLQLGPDISFQRLKHHWETWITEDDFIKIKSYGFNSVRLPIGYWTFAHLIDDPYVFGQEEYLEKSIEWCRNHGLKLWIDLHGIPGSQNGFDNSGRRDHLQWMNPITNYNLGLEVIRYIFEKYGDDQYSDVVIGYQNLNEPLHNVYQPENIIKFDKEAYKLLRQITNNYFVYHDSFLDVEFWEAYLLEPEFIHTVLDHHRYQVFETHLLKYTVDEHLEALKKHVSRYMAVDKLQVIGEWSAALTDCGKWLNGVGRGARYDNTYAGTGVIGECKYSDDPSKLTDQDRDNTRRFIEGQLDLYGKVDGFFFWTYKTESAIEWSMKDLLEIGLFPQPLSDRKYPKIA